MNLTIPSLLLGCLIIPTVVANSSSPIANEMTMSGGKLSRKRVQQSGTPKLQNFGRLTFESDRETFREMNWNRFLEETSFTNEPQCKLELEFECYLANDRHVSFAAV
jgi:hypothetical protein